MNSPVPDVTQSSRRFRFGVLVALLALGGGGLRAGSTAEVAPPGPAEARPMEPLAESRHSRTIAPTSGMDADTALRVATAIAGQVKGARVMTISRTGSMRPILDGNAIIVVEPTAYDDLRVGDIITYEHPGLHQVIVHRILEKRGDTFWTKGDHNDRMDNVYVTRENYLMRVFAIVYSQDDVVSGLARHAPAAGVQTIARKTS